MKRLFLVGLFLAWCGLAVAADKFWAQLTPEERAAAGLAELTGEQQVALDRLADRYAKEGARQAIEVAKVTAKAEGKVEGKAEALATVAEKKKATIGLAPREDDETEVIRTKILGDFRGWNGHTTFQLENSQMWQQTDGESRYFPKMVDPAVEIRPSRLGGWKLTLLKEGLWIRVKRLR